MALPNGLAQVSDVGALEGLLGNDIAYVPVISVPNTVISGRAPMYDLTNDVGVRMGLNRHTFQQSYLIDGEAGPNGEVIWGVTNDPYNQVRFGGNWGAFNQNGQGMFTIFAGDFVEFTFYGTGLNLITFSFSGVRDATAYVDGTSIGTFTESNASTSQILVRQYSPNVIRPIVNNLTLGLHTVRLVVLTGTFDIFGFETVNNSSNIVVNKGTTIKNGQRLYNSAQFTSAYNSNFESGTLGLKGGRVAVYQKADGSIAKSLTPTDASQLNMSNASHTNEEVARVWTVREFGAARGDDFSSGSINASNGGKSFAANDGTHLLSSNTFFPVNNGPVSALEGTGVGNAGDFLTFTFVGTGLDVYQTQLTSGLTAQDIVQIDGTTIATGTGGTSIWRQGIVKIVSGLPYGTHTFRYAKTVNGSGAAFNRFIVYQPKTPTIPTGASLIGSYNIMANFVANTTAGLLTTSTGVLKKSHQREFYYQDGTGGSASWTLGASGFTTLDDGIDLYTDRNGAFFEYTFFGTGFDMRGYGGTDNKNGSQVSLQNLGTGGSLLNLTTTNFPTITSTNCGGWSFAPSTGLLNQNSAATPGSGFTVSGLPLGVYRVRVTSTNGTSGTYLRMSSIDIITPIHSTKENGPFTVQNALPLGSQGVKNHRLLPSEVKQKNRTLVQAILTNPNTSSTSPVPIPDMCGTHYSKTGKIRITWNVQSSNNTAGGISYFRTLVDGVVYNPDKANVFQAGGAGSAVTTTESFVLPVGVGWHNVCVYYWTSAGLHYILSGGTRLIEIEDVD